MNDLQPQQQKVLYLVMCAAPLAQDIHQLIVLAQERQWDVCAIATPQATRFIDTPLLTRLTGHPLRSDYKLPGEPDVFPKADAIVVAPATFNTINKWALGIADTLAVSILCEALGGNIPIIAVPYLKADLAQHPAFHKSIGMLRDFNIRVLCQRPPVRDRRLVLPLDSTAPRQTGRGVPLWLRCPMRSVAVDKYPVLIQSCRTRSVLMVTFLAPMRSACKVYRHSGF